MDKIVGNGIHAEDGSYAFGPQPLASFAAAVAGDSPEYPAEKGALPFFDCDSLAEVGWGLVTPADDGGMPGVREALKPLLELRREQAGKRFRDDLVVHAGSSVNRFLTHHGSGPGLADPRHVPYYLLLIGGPDRIPFEFQYLLDVQYAVGRLSFESVEEYANYAAGVVACERGEVRRRRRVEIFGVRNWDDPATELSEAGLVEPLKESLDEVGGWQTGAWRREQATKSRLCELLAGDAALLFVSSHGLLFQSGSPSQKKREGSLLCYDWPGPRSWQGTIGRDLYVSAGDVDATADLRGLMAFLFACNSAGTPRLDSYSRARGAEIPRDAADDFVAPLPRKLLGRPDGALAVIGHVDGIWPVSYRWSSLESRIGHFEALFHELMRGRPVGLAMEALGQRHGSIADVITDELEQQRTATADPGDSLSREEGLVRLWTAHNDARSYLLLGDPAVRPAVGSGS